MKTKFIALALGALLITGMPEVHMYAQGMPVCEEYPDFQPLCFQRATDVWVYYIGPADLDFPPADSVWVVGPINIATESQVLVIHEGEGEPMDLSSLSRGFYLFCVQLWDCVGCRQIFIRQNPIPEDINNIFSAPSVTKLLRNGQIFIQRGGKMYNATGAEVK